MISDDRLHIDIDVSQLLDLVLDLIGDVLISFGGFPAKAYWLISLVAFSGTIDRYPRGKGLSRT